MQRIRHPAIRRAKLLEVYRMVLVALLQSNEALGNYNVVAV